MRKKILSLVIILLLVFESTSAEIKAINPGATFTNNGVTYHYMEATAYCIHGTTATGSRTRKGICASSEEHLGQVAMVYLNDNGKPGEFLGYLECLDTGGKAIQSGKVLDVWLPTYNECIQFGRKQIMVVWVDGVG